VARAVSELVQTEGMHLSGFFIKKKPPFNALKKSTCIPKLLYSSELAGNTSYRDGCGEVAALNRLRKNSTRREVGVSQLAEELRSLRDGGSVGLPAPRIMAIKSAGFSPGPFMATLNRCFSETPSVVPKRTEGGFRNPRMKPTKLVPALATEVPFACLTRNSEFFCSL
jgi:hypothetical protein